jgi:ElaB/YqjD/DUF883 family membrane-anchored ribosome-binding protein
MESTFDGSTDQVRAAGRRLRNDLADSAGTLKESASAEIKSLIADVEDLVARVADLKDADVIRVRTRVENAIASAKQGLADGVETVKSKARFAATTADDYVHESPWQALGIAALAGVVVGFLAARRS